MIQPTNKTYTRSLSVQQRVTQERIHLFTKRQQAILLVKHFAVVAVVPTILQVSYHRERLCINVHMCVCFSKHLWMCIPAVLQNLYNCLQVFCFPICIHYFSVVNADRLFAYVKVSLYVSSPRYLRWITFQSTCANKMLFFFQMHMYHPGSKFNYLYNIRV